MDSNEIHIVPGFCAAGTPRHLPGAAYPQGAA